MRQLIMECYTVIERLKDAELESLWDIPMHLTEQEHNQLEVLFDRICQCEEHLAEMAYGQYLSA